jgi:hypothetical protein
MKSRFVLAVLLTILSFRSIAQRQNANGDVRTKRQQDTAHKKDVTGSCAPSQSTTDSTNQQTTGNADKNQDERVRVTSIPEVPIKPRKDALDGIIVACTVVLTIVGIVGTYAAIKTLRQNQTVKPIRWMSTKPNLRSLRQPLTITLPPHWPMLKP